MYDYYEPKLVDEPINVALNAAIARQANAAAGGPLMDPTELNDEIGL